MKRKVLSILCCASLVLNSSIVFASDVSASLNTSDEGVIEDAPINPEFEEYMNKKSRNADENNSNTEDDNTDDVNYGIIPDLYEIPYIKSENADAGIATVSSLPTSYNTNSTKEYVSPVKNQYGRGLCWAFAALGNFESSLLLKRGDDNDTYDFSENHMSYATSTDGDNTYGFDKGASDGGSFSYAMPYLVRGIMNGPVNEEDDPYDLTADADRTAEDTASFPVEDYYARETIQLANLSSNYSDEDLTERINEIKQLVYEYGSVYIHFYIDGTYLNSNTYAYYTTNSSVNHAVCIVGWDDDYSTDNFNSDCVPDIEGAFVVKNSWGSSWGNNGYFYLSYADAGIIQSVSTISDMSDRSFYDNLYEYDVFGKTGSMGYGKGKTVVGANKFERVNTETTETLKSIMTFNSAQDTYIKAYVSTTGNFADLEEYSLSGMGSETDYGYLMDYPGYKTLDFEDEIVLDSDEYIVCIEMYNENYGYPLPYEGVSSITSNATADTDQSYYSSSISNMINGSGTDMASVYSNRNLFLKAYTTNNIEESDVRIWNFSDDDFSSIGVISKETTINDLTFNASSNGYFRGGGGSKTIGLWKFTNSIVVPSGTDLGVDSSEGTISFEVDGPTEVYIAAKANTEDSTTDAKLTVYNASTSKAITCSDGVSYDNFTGIKKYVYTGSKKTTLRIAAATNTMKIYAIFAKPYNNDSSDIDKTWDMGDIYSVNSLDTEYDGLKLNYDDEHTVKFNNYSTTNYGMSYTGYVNLNGTGTLDYRNFEFYSPRDTDIYVTARSSDDENVESTRELLLVNEIGYEIGRMTFSNKVTTQKITYNPNTCGGETLLLMSTDSGVHIYDISVVKRKTYDDIEKSWDFDDEIFDDYVGTISSSVTVDDLTLSADSSHTIKLVELTDSDGETERAVELTNAGLINYRNIKFDVPGSAYIRCEVASANDNYTRDVLIFSSKGVLLAQQTVNSNKNYVDLHYTGCADTLYIRTLEEGVYVYGLSVCTDEYIDISSADTTELTIESSLDTENVDNNTDTDLAVNNTVNDDADEQLSDSEDEALNSEMDEEEYSEVTEITENLENTFSEEDSSMFEDEITTEISEDISEEEISFEADENPLTEV